MDCSVGMRMFTPLAMFNLLLTLIRWPWGNEDMNAYTDASYFVSLNQTGVPKPYMMPVSPVSILIIITINNEVFHY